MRKAIVTTTVNEPTAAIMRYIEIAKRDDWTIIVVGDKKTPHESYLKLCEQYDFIEYISPEKQQSKWPELSDLIGWNCIQRRNFGFISAYNMGAEIIATVDDDNIPYDTWGQMLAVATEPHVAVHQSLNPVFDPLSVTEHNDLWHRGFPVQWLSTKNRTSFLGRFNRPRCLVQADFWDGEPDVDAVCRIAKGPFDVRFNHEPFAATAPGPFNSQNTFLHRDAFPTYFMFPHIGRMDDIWASYILQRKFPDSVVYGSASVYQERNDHDLSKDLAAEMIGYSKTPALIELLQDTRITQDATLIAALGKFMPLSALEAWHVYKQCFKQPKGTLPGTTAKDGVGRINKELAKDVSKRIKVRDE